MTRPVNAPALLSISQAARLLGVGRSTLYEGIRVGTSVVPVVRVGKQWRVPRAAVERLLEGRLPGYEASATPPAAPSARPSECCRSCGALVTARAARTCSAALRSSSRIGSV